MIPMKNFNRWPGQIKTMSAAHAQEAVFHISCFVYPAIGVFVWVVVCVGVGTEKVSLEPSIRCTCCFGSYLQWLVSMGA